MAFCENYTILNIIMYIKYITLFLLIINIIYFIYTQSKRSTQKWQKKIIMFLSVLTVLYLLFFAITNVLNLNSKSCFNNSNPLKKELYKQMDKAYKDKVLEPNSFLSEIKPSNTTKVMGRKINIYNQFDYPLSNYKFNLNDKTKLYSFKNSGNEITTLASLLSSTNIGNEVDPIALVDLFNQNNLETLDMNQMLAIAATEYDFQYMPISLEQIYYGIKNEGIVLAKIHGNSEGTVFTCSDEYILIYNVDSGENYKIISSTNREYPFVCPVGSKGFGNTVPANINESGYPLIMFKDNIDYLYLVWR